jgi:hypothetical protein
MKTRALILAVLAGGMLWAHDMDIHVEKAPGAIAVRFSYGDDDPARGADVTVFGPGDAATPYQTGKTDPRGVFVFAPDRAGEWRVVADDGEGHREEAKVSVAEDGAIAFDAHTHGRGATWVTGVSVLFGLTGLALWWTGRRRPSGPAA